MRLTLIEICIYVTKLKRCGDVIHDIRSYSIRNAIKHNYESDHIVSKAINCEKLKSNMLLEFICTDKSDLIFFFIIRVVYIHRPVCTILKWVLFHQLKYMAMILKFFKKYPGRSSFLIKLQT